MKRDQRGAIIVMALPMALFLIGMLHFAIGIGDAIIARETMQDAADASAFSAAVMMARGMNLIVLINVVMASLVAVLVMLRLTQVMILTGLALCSLLSVVTAGATVEAIPLLRAADAAVTGYYETARLVVNPMLVALNTTATVLRYAMPVAAEARVVDTSRRYAPPALVGFAIPHQFPLPTEDGTERQLCGKAGEYAAKFATLPIRALLPDPVLDVLEDGLSAATTALAGYFCASSNSGGPPAIPIPDKNVRQELPKLPKMRECEDFVNTTGEISPEHERICSAAQVEIQMSQPDSRTGACAHADCSAYGTRIDLARIECVPNQRARFEEWVWQERDVIENAEVHPRDPYPRYVERLPVEYGEPRWMRGAQPPCGRGGAVATAWNTDVAEPLCMEPHGELSPEGPWTDKESSPVVLVTYRVVLQMLSCSKRVLHVSPTRPSGPPPTQMISQTSRCGVSYRVHQNVRTGAALGNETFQLRAVVVGEVASTKQRNILESVVLRDRGTESPWAGSNVGDVLQQASRLFVAQAEYYFDADAASGRGADRLEWMWTMDWRARLVRFRLPEHDASQAPSSRDGCGVAPPSLDVTAACNLAQGGDACANVDSSLINLSDLVLH